MPVYVKDCEAVSIYIIDYLEKFLTDFDEVSRMMSNNKRQVPPEDEISHCGGTITAHIENAKFTK